MQMSVLCSVPVVAGSRWGVRSPLLAIRPGVAPARTRRIPCRAQTQGLVPLSETAMQGNTEPMVYKAIKAACLLPAVACLLWAEPAHAKKARQPAAAAQVVEVQTAETHSAAEQLQAKWQRLTLQLQDGSLLQQAKAELRKPDVQKGLAAVAGLLLVAMIWKGASGSSSTTGSTTTTSSSSSNGSGSSSGSTSSSTAMPAPAAVAAAAPLAAAAPSSNSAPPLHPAQWQQYQQSSLLLLLPLQLL
ncbi:hypothetical protein COO60DRAFT_901119 [Scenedesmus sp. NREL 46B-D3]|nr:hypothetical protein COO60DRAFT_901119 [Scenedesmus sp. NREL 46B-D3]